jgi:DNA polymerase-1
VLFCKLYGGGIKKTAFLLDCPVDEAAKFVGKFDQELPGIQRYMKAMISKAQMEGKIVNPLGRTYFIQPDFAYRAVNYMIQGTAADMMKRTMVNVDKYLREEWPGCAMLLTLHDELVIEVPTKYHSKKLMRGIIVEMQRDSKLVGVPVPLPVSMKIAKDRWSKTTDITI